MTRVAPTYAHRQTHSGGDDDDHRMTFTIYVYTFMGATRGYARAFSDENPISSLAF